MIARIWHGVTRVEHADEYHRYLLETGVVDYRGTPGNRGVYILRDVRGDEAHFLTISLWDSLDAIRQFAGVDYRKPRYWPKDKKYLLELEPEAQHYEVLFAP